jgi:isopropylmalate/homocitrate/citramalate synthase
MLEISKMKDAEFDQRMSLKCLQKLEISKMKKETASKFVVKEIRNLGFEVESRDLAYIFERAVKLTERATKREVKKFIADQVAFFCL